MVSISPKDLAKVIKEDPEAFINAIKEASEKHQKRSAEKALEEQFKNPAEIPTKGRVTVGNPDAKVTIVEFLDLQCIACARTDKRIKSMVDRYEGKVNLVYKHFPLSFHPFAKPAAEYFEAIALVDHEKARAFHDTIFDNFSDYASLKEEKDIKESLKALVKKIDLNIKTVEGNIGKAKKTVQQDMAEAEKLKVRGTPSFFVNGVSPPGGQIELVIEKFLEKSK